MKKYQPCSSCLSIKIERIYYQRHLRVGVWHNYQGRIQRRKAPRHTFSRGWSGGHGSPKKNVRMRDLAYIWGVFFLFKFYELHVKSDEIVFGHWTKWNKIIRNFTFYSTEIICHHSGFQRLHIFGASLYYPTSAKSEVYQNWYVVHECA